ncbi:MAG: wax ester/triacylglycerol synthase family O-acyltransferase [Actinomycetota bacterium]|nr:wax ester/triacylglycerol synthase family O-acyltransferase [Actinomycetota bacterium]
MKQLTGLDSAFLMLERHNSTGHVGGVCVLDTRGAPAALDLAAVCALIESRLHLIPIMRQHLVEVPLGLDQPYWVDDTDFDIEYHVREVSLPRPGANAQLAEQVSRLHARPLDRTRPLWEAYLISGLSGGRLALYTKMHHAAIDGVSGAELMTLLLDLSPEGRAIAATPPFVPRPAPSNAQLLARAAGSLLASPVQAARIAKDVVRSLPLVGGYLSPYVGNLFGRLEQDSGVISALPGTAISALPGTGRPPRTPFNKPITPHRRWAFRTVALEDVRKVKIQFDVSVNDVVMAMCAGAVRTWLQGRDALPEQPLVAMVPVSVRDEASKSALGNKVAAMLATLPTHLDDPLERLTSAHHATQVAKAQHAAIPAGLVENVTDFAPPALTARAARVAFAMGLPHRLPPFNLVISNIPGPNIQAYLGGAKLLANYPVSVLLDGQGFNITVCGYRGGLHFGLIACRELVPDVDDIAGYLVDELAQLVSLAAAAS